MRAPVRLLGIGSPHGPDRIGWRIADGIERRIRARPELGASMEIHARAAPDGRMLECLEDARLGVFVDALVGIPAGKMRRFDDPDAFEETCPLTSHGLGLREMLRLGEVLDALPRSIWIYGVGVSDAGNGGVSDGGVATFCTRILDDILAYLDQAD